MTSSPYPFTPDQWISERWVRGTRSYSAQITQTLFGDWVLVRAWGSMTSKNLKSLSELADSYDHALLLLDKVRKQRCKRHYTPCRTGERHL